jgi:hypothetical protein
VRPPLLLLLLLPTACASSFPNAHHVVPFEDVQATRVLGCVQMGWLVGQDDQLPERSFLLELSLRNVCFEPVPLDLSAMRVTAYDEDGTEHGVTMYDPRHEIRPLRIDSERTSHENIQLDVATSQIEAVRRICFDVASVSPDAVRTAPAPACVDAPHPRAKADQDGAS